MRNHLLKAAFAAALLAGCAVAATGDAAAQNDENGSGQDWTSVQWSIKDSRGLAPGEVQFEISKRTRNSNWTHSDSMPLSNLQGLSREQLASSSGAPVRFRFARETGTLDCEGIVRRQRGTGDCTFQADPRFVAGLRQRGIGTANPMQLFSMAMGNIGLSYIDELERQRYARPTVEDLVKAGNHGAGLDYLRSMGALGYRAGTVAALVRMRDHGVTADYVKDLAKYGIRDLPADELVRLRDHGVSLAFVGEMRKLGYANLSTDQLIRLRDHGVSADYVRQLAGHGIRNVPTDTLVRLRDHGVSADFVGELRRHGYGNLSTDEIIRLRDHGVTADYVGELRELGYARLSAEDIVRLRTHGVTTDFIRRINSGSPRTPEELVRARVSN